jgi:hypothetical protein
MSDEATKDGMTLEIPCDSKGKPFLPGDYLGYLDGTVIGYAPSKEGTLLVCAMDSGYVCFRESAKVSRCKDSVTNVLGAVKDGFRVDWAELRMKRIMEGQGR